MRDLRGASDAREGPFSGSVGITGGDWIWYRARAEDPNDPYVQSLIPRDSEPSFCPFDVDMFQPALLVQQDRHIW